MDRTIISKPQNQIIDMLHLFLTDMAAGSPEMLLLDVGDGLAPRGIASVTIDEKAADIVAATDEIITVVEREIELRYHTGEVLVISASIQPTF